MVNWGVIFEYAGIAGFPVLRADSIGPFARRGDIILADFRLADDWVSRAMLFLAGCALPIFVKLLEEESLGFKPDV